MRPCADPIDHLLALDLGSRGIEAFFVRGAATAAASALRDARRVLIGTGFTVAADTPETDGPPGSAVLGRALRRLGARVTYVTDPLNVPVLEAALQALDEPVAVEVYPEGDGAAPALLARARPTHLVAVERPGRTRSGQYLNLRGESIDPWNRRIDELFLCWPSRSVGGRPGSQDHGRGSLRSSSSRSHSKPSRPRKGSRPVTVGVGDGGNEIGMGNVRLRLARAGAMLARIASIVRVDHLVVAGTSNWGAYGIVAALERLTSCELLHTPAEERRLVAACVDAGAFDGVTRRREVTVDGLSLDTHAAIVELLRGVWGRQSLHAARV